MTYPIPLPDGLEAEVVSQAAQIKAQYDLMVKKERTIAQLVIERDTVNRRAEILWARVLDLERVLIEISKKAEDYGPINDWWLVDKIEEVLGTQPKNLLEGEEGIDYGND